MCIFLYNILSEKKKLILIDNFSVFKYFIFSLILFFIVFMFLYVSIIFNTNKKKLKYFFILKCK